MPLREYLAGRGRLWTPLQTQCVSKGRSICVAAVFPTMHLLPDLWGLTLHWTSTGRFHEHALACVRANVRVCARACVKLRTRANTPGCACRAQYRRHSYLPLVHAYSCAPLSTSAHASAQAFHALPASRIDLAVCACPHAPLILLWICTQIPTFRVNPVQPECDRWCW